MRDTKGKKSETKEKKYSMIARHDRAHCLAPGLFRSFQKGETRPKLDITYDYGQEKIRFVGFEALGPDDMRFLQGLVALAGPRGLILSKEPKTEIGVQLRLFLDPRFDAADKNTLVVKDTYRNLLSLVGLSCGGKNIRNLKNSLLRMSNVTVIVTIGQRQASFHLLSYAVDDVDGRILIALNPRLAEAILGNTNYAKIILEEVRALKSDVARLVHQRLCAWIDPGKSAKVRIDTLCRYVWPNNFEKNRHKKRAKIIRALRELCEIGWAVEVNRQTATIKRPDDETTESTTQLKLEASHTPGSTDHSF